MKALNTYLAQLVAAIFGFCRTYPALFVGGCAALAVSRVCQVIAFFLPLKLFIVIHSGEIPDYFDVFPESMGFREIITVLSALVPVIYGLYVMLGICYRWLMDHHLMRMNNSELVISGTKITAAKLKRLHNHGSKAFSEIGLILVSVTASLWLDVMIAIVWMVLLYLNLWLFHRKAFHAEDHHRLTFLKLHRRQFIDYISSANFLAVFAVLALELVFFDMGVYSAIFLLLVSRMVFQALNRFSVESLYILKLLP